MADSSWRSRSLDWFNKSGAKENEGKAVQTYADYLKWDEFSTLRLHDSVTVHFAEEGSLGIKIGVERGKEPDAATIHYIQGLNDTDEQGNPRQLDALKQCRIGDVITHVNRKSIVQMDTPGVLTLLKDPERPMAITVMRHNQTFHRDVEKGDKGFAEDVIVVRKDVARYVPATVSPNDLRDLIFFESNPGGSSNGRTKPRFGSIEGDDFEPTTTDEEASSSTTDDEFGSTTRSGQRKPRSHSSSRINRDDALISASSSCSNSESSDSEEDDDDLDDALDGVVGSPTSAVASPSKAGSTAKTVRRVQRRLTDVLMAVTRRLQETSGYAQGMHSIVALFLGAGLNEERAFWMMVTIVEQLCERGFYASSAGTRVEVAVGSVRGLANKSLSQSHGDGTPGCSPTSRRDSSSTPSVRPALGTPRTSRATSAYHDISVMLQETEVAVQLLKLSWPVLQPATATASQGKQRSSIFKAPGWRSSKSAEDTASAGLPSGNPAGIRAVAEGIRMISPSVLIPLFVGCVPLAVTLIIWDDLFNVRRDSNGRLLSGGSVTLLQAFVTLLDMQYKSFEAICTSRRPESTRIYAMLSANLAQIDPVEFRTAFESIKASVTADRIEECRNQARKILTFEAERRRRTVRLQNVMARFNAWARHYPTAGQQYQREFGGHLSHLGEAQDDKAPAFAVMLTAPSTRGSPTSGIAEEDADPPFNLIDGKLQKLGRSTMKWKGCQCQLSVKHLLVTQGRTSKPIEIRRVVQVMGGMAAFEIFEDAATDTVFGLEAGSEGDGLHSGNVASRRGGHADLKWHTFRALPGSSVWVWKKWLRELLKMEWGEDFFHEEFDDDIEQWVFYNSETHNTERLSQLRGGSARDPSAGPIGLSARKSGSSPHLRPQNTTTPASSPGSPLGRSQTAPLGSQMAALSLNTSRSRSGSGSSSPSGKSQRPAAPPPPSNEGETWHDAETGVASPPSSSQAHSPQPSAGLLCPFCKFVFDSKPELKKHVVGCTGTPPMMSSLLLPSASLSSPITSNHSAPPQRSASLAGTPGANVGGRASVPRRSGSLPAGVTTSASAGADSSSTGAANAQGAGDLPLDITGLSSQSEIRAAKERQVVENTFRSQFRTHSDGDFVTSAQAVTDTKSPNAANAGGKDGESDDEWQPELLE